MENSEEKLVQAAQVAAQGGPRKIDRRARILDYKDQLREQRRADRLTSKGY
jgi:hypothetical protein